MDSIESFEYNGGGKKHKKVAEEQTDEESAMKYFKDYLKLKTKYFDEFTTDPEKSRPIHRVFGVKTNCPLVFREKNGAYIVEVIHPSCPDKVYYRHTIHVHNYIDLTHLHQRIIRELDAMNVSQERLYYLRKIELYNQRKAKLAALQSIPSRNPAENTMTADLYREEMTQLESDIQEFKDQYTQWLNQVKKYTDQLYAIQQIMNELRDERQQEFNTNQMQYFYLWNKQMQQRDLDIGEQYKITKLLYQPKEIEKGSVVEHGGEWYVVMEANKQKKDLLVTMKPLSALRESGTGEEKGRTMTALASEMTHQEGFYSQWKRFTYRQNIRIPKDKWRSNFMGDDADLDMDEFQSVAEVVLEEYPETPDRRPRHIMMSYINEDTCELDVSVEEEKREKKEKKKKKKEEKKKSKKEKKSKKDKKTDGEKDEAEEELESEEADQENESKEELQGDEVEEEAEESELEESDEELLEEETLEKSPEEVEEEEPSPKEVEKTPSPVKVKTDSVKRGRLMIQIPKKKRTGSISPSPRRHSPIRDSSKIAPKKSSLKRREEGQEKKPTTKEYYKRAFQLYDMYLERIYREKDQAEEEMKEEYPERYARLSDTMEDDSILYFSMMPEYDKDEEIPKDALDMLKDSLIKLFPEFVDKVLMKGKPTKVLDTVSLYNNLVHGPEEMKWVDPSEDEEAYMEESESEEEESDEEESEVDEEQKEKVFRMFQEQMKKMEAQKK